MPTLAPCPKCQSEYVYQNDELLICLECFYEWNPSNETAEKMADNESLVLDSNGNALKDGDAVIIIKDLKVKGAPKPLKAGTKVKNIRLNKGSDHNLDCKIEGFGSMGLKSEFVRKS